MSVWSESVRVRFGDVQSEFVFVEGFLYNIFDNTQVIYLFIYLHTTIQKLGSARLLLTKTVLYVNI